MTASLCDGRHWTTQAYAGHHIRPKRRLWVKFMWHGILPAPPIGGLLVIFLCSKFHDVTVLTDVCNANMAFCLKTNTADVKYMASFANYLHSEQTFMLKTAIIGKLTAARWSRHRSCLRPSEVHLLGNDFGILHVTDKIKYETFDECKNNKDWKLVNVSFMKGEY